MERFGEDFLLQAIHSEIIARDAYADMAEKIKASDGKAVIAAMSKEEEHHRTVLADRYKALAGRDYTFDSNMDAGPDFSFIKESTFGYTGALDALRLALSAEIDAIKHYSHALDGAADREDKKMLTTLIKFEKGHKKKLEKELKKLTSTNHWQMDDSEQS